jgi:hypothetical protein
MAVATPNHGAVGGMNGTTSPWSPMDSWHCHWFYRFVRRMMPLLLATANSILLHASVYVDYTLFNLVGK